MSMQVMSVLSPNELQRDLAFQKYGFGISDKGMFVHEQGEQNVVSALRGYRRSMLSSLSLFFYVL